MRAEAIATRPQAAYSLKLTGVTSVAEQQAQQTRLQSPVMRELAAHVAKGAIPRPSGRPASSRVRPWSKRWRSSPGNRW
ncbi:hypothetical protein NWF32_12795 [Pseudomonas qingdaonensis]|nr:hypothetical protein [Pseudomonas qingdaonensis]